MKLLVFAHKPPPHHGQSYMVQLLLEALAGEASSESLPPPIQCHHLDARYSTDYEDLGRARFGKVFLAVKYSMRAIWWRFRHGAKHLYYVPAFPIRSAIYRDWLVLGLCRPFFHRVIFHWHAVGLGEWIQTEARPWERWFCRLVFRRADLSIVLRPYNRLDAQLLEPRRIEVVANGVPDPCPDFESAVLPRRLARVAARKALLKGGQLSPSTRAEAGRDAHIFRLLFISLCYSGKGLFDLVEAVALARRKLQDSPVKIRLTVAGTFWLEPEKVEFQRRIGASDLQDEGQPMVEYRGFVKGEEKKRMFVESDCLCFPTRMPESFGLVLVEGMAFGLPLITTNWRSIPEMLPPGVSGIVEPNSPEQIAAAAMSYRGSDYDPALREWFLEHYTDKQFAANLRKVLVSVEQDDRSMSGP